MRRALVMIVGIGMATHLPARDVPKDIGNDSDAHCSERGASIPLPAAGEPVLRPFAPATSLI